MWSVCTLMLKTCATAGAADSPRTPLVCRTSSHSNSLSFVLSRSAMVELGSPAAPLVSSFGIGPGLQCEA